MSFWLLGTFGTWCVEKGFDAALRLLLSAETPDPYATTRVEDPALGPLGGEVIGREVALAELHTALCSSSHKAALRNRVSVRGGGGVGKTTLAFHYAQEMRKTYRGIWIIRCDTRGGGAAGARMAITDSFAALGKTLGIEGFDTDRPGLAQAARARIAEDSDPWLLIYDNAEDPKHLKHWLPKVGEDRPHVHVIVTAREGAWEEWGAVEVPIDCLGYDTPAAAGPKLLAREAGLDPDENARALAEDLGGLPLALKIAGRYVGAMPDMGFDDYRAEIEQVLTQPAPNDYPLSIAASVGLSYDRCSEAERALLHLYAYLSPDGVEAWLVSGLPSAPHISSYQGHIPDSIHALARDEKVLEQVLQGLVARSLLTEVQPRMHALHRMTGAVIRANLGEAGTGWRASAVVVVAASYPSRPDLSEFWPTCHQLAPQVEVVLGGADLPPIPATDFLLNQASVFLWQQGQRERPVDYARRALAMLQTRLPKDHPQIAAGQSLLGAALKAAGRLYEALAALEEAVRICQMHEADGAGMAAILNNYAAVLLDLERFREAAKAHQRALSLHLRNLGRLHPSTAASVANLGAARWRERRLGAALRLDRYALWLTEQMVERGILPEDDAQIANRHHNLGVSYLQVGEARRALPLFETALGILRAAGLNDDHPKVAITLRFIEIVRGALGYDQV